MISTSDMASKLLLLFAFWNLLLAAHTAPTKHPSIPEGFDLNQEMTIFKELLRKEFAAAKEKVKKLKEKKCENIEDCINQSNLLKELKETYGNKNPTLESLFSKATAFPTTANDERKT